MKGGLRMIYSEFKEILTGLFNGNSGAAEQVSENMPKENTEFLFGAERIQQNRINYDRAVFKKACQNKTMI